jgi:hypothetical protein
MSVSAPWQPSQLSGDVMTMKSQDGKVSTARHGEDQTAHSEVESYLRALQSYPERFANDPKLSFEQYFVRVAEQ